MAPSTVRACLLDAVDTFKKEVEQNPSDANARYNLGTAYLYEGKHLEAAEQFRVVVEKKPDDEQTKEQA